MIRLRPWAEGPLPVSAIVAVLALAAQPVACAGQDVRQSVHHDYRVVTVVDGLTRPWAIAWLPNGDMLVTEKPGRLRIVRDGELLSEPVTGVPEVYDGGQGGLLDVVLHPEFEENRFVYLSYSRPFESEAEYAEFTDYQAPASAGGRSRGEHPASTAVARARFEGDALHDLEVLWVARSRGYSHYGSRIAFGHDGYMYVSAGDRQVGPRGGLDDLMAHPSQDLSNHHGVIVRLHDDGRIPADNPFVGTDDALADIYSYGHRNPQGLAVHPETGELWSNEHGPQGGDEVNVVSAGTNYGWPVIGYGVNYGSGSTIHVGTRMEGMEDPLHVWVPSIATSGLTIYDGDAFPYWRGNVFVGGLRGEQLARLTVDGQTVTGEETLARGVGRVRDVRQGPDGLIYLALDNRRDGNSAIVRLEPDYLGQRRTRAPEEGDRTSGAAGGAS